jgi:hypothetical protein
MPSDNKNSPIQIEVGAAAKYERKTNVSIEVPEDVTRAKAKALLDAISPFTGSLGIVGDWLADKRIELRLQRLQKLITVASKAQEAIDGQSAVAGSVPIKALLPMLEKASLEEGEDETLTDAWAALLASASIDYDPEVLTFTRILSEFGPREALVLSRLYGGRRKWALGDRNEKALTRFFESEEAIKPMIRRAVADGDPGLFPRLRGFVDESWPMEFTLAFTRGASVRANWIDKRLLEPFYEAHSVGYTILAHQGLIELSGQGYAWMNGETPVGVNWATLTDLGGRFMVRVTLPTTK